MTWDVFIIAAAVVAGATWLELRRQRRHRARNDAGQCAHCTCRLESWRVRQAGYGDPFKHHPIRADVCLDCHARHRRRRWMLYLAVPPLAVILLIVFLEQTRF